MGYGDAQERKYEREEGPTSFANHLASKIKKKDMNMCVAGKIGLCRGESQAALAHKHPSEAVDTWSLLLSSLLDWAKTPWRASQHGKQ